MMKRIIRNRLLNNEEALKYNTARKNIATELPELLTRHHDRTGGIYSEEVQGPNDKMNGCRQSEGR